MPRKEVRLSDAVVELVKAATPTLEDFADESGIGYSTLRDWLRRPRAPRSANLARVVKAARQQRDELDRLIEQVERLAADRP